MKLPIHLSRLALLLVLAAPASAADSAARANIVFIISDDQAIINEVTDIAATEKCGQPLQDVV